MQPIFRSYWIGLHRTTKDAGKEKYYNCMWDDESPCDYGDVPASALRSDYGKSSAPNYPWSTGQPSGNGLWTEGFLNKGLSKLSNKQKFQSSFNT
jgi:hypothetical protein